jgi:hypothetical protein
MVRLRMDRCLRGRVDPSDVLREAQVEILRRAAEYGADLRMPPRITRKVAGRRRGRPDGPLRIER